MRGRDGDGGTVEHRKASRPSVVVDKASHALLVWDKRARLDTSDRLAPQPITSSIPSTISEAIARSRVLPAHRDQ
jgi:hypothetical protein